MFRCFNFEPRFKLRWFRARELFGSQLPATPEVLNCESLVFKYSESAWPIRPYGLVGQVIHMQEIHSSKPAVTRICDSNNS